MACGLPQARLTRRCRAASVLAEVEGASSSGTLTEGQHHDTYEYGSRAVILSGLLTVANNATGVLADGAGTVTIQSDPSKPSSIENNGTDVDLKLSRQSPKC